MAFAHRNPLAKTLRSLHIPGNPIVLTNCYDAATASAVCSHPSTKAVATASYAIAATSGFTDAGLILEANLAGIRRISAVVENFALPLTADMQDGYEDLATNIRKAIEAGAVGCNLEDENHETEELRPFGEAVERISRAVAAAKECGVPDFCVNARTDVVAKGGTIEEAIERGKAFLKAGALTVFVWGGPSGRGLRDEEIRRLVEGLGGMVNVKMNLRAGFLNSGELARLGVARISIGPELFLKAMEGFNAALQDLHVNAKRF
ncbi:uncharacterized protein MYCFIDRAFT_209831 [Pseudocercospora fijiensis CIRAD86]|uniref:Carboxyphosphonoenolpyruvate phosphonomutase-like protein n=1 Tax=Pseudocercospora fijiensis (strain CIRAD86) TaxID=383855 RepID=N1Q9N0_PSEFD|nr:uncharacterized protein MYCFIDRAFT_209831 [Pseudocercospora fijiensis CIRAD86]EME88506.1 hypothetical protein MYCFIDRAFT_209831 [Pseudocercospora fijiensis CIRAD86]